MALTASPAFQASYSHNSPVSPSLVPSTTVLYVQSKVHAWFVPTPTIMLMGSLDCVSSVALFRIARNASSILPNVTSVRLDIGCTLGMECVICLQLSTASRGSIGGVRTINVFDVSKGIDPLWTNSSA